MELLKILGCSCRGPCESRMGQANEMTSSSP